MPHYTADDHKKAFEFYHVLRSVSAVSQEKGMPSRPTLTAWSKPDFTCSYNCKWHGYEQLVGEIQSKVRERVEDGIVPPADSSSLQNLRSDKYELERLVRSDVEKVKYLRFVENLALKRLQARENKDDPDSPLTIQVPDTVKEIQDIISRVWREEEMIMGLPSQRIAVDMRVAVINIDPILDLIPEDNQKEVMEALQREYSHQTHS